MKTRVERMVVVAQWLKHSNVHLTRSAKYPRGVTPFQADGHLLDQKFALKQKKKKKNNNNKET